MTDLVFEALKVATKAHDGQYDKGGAPYILHPITVARGVQSDTEKIIALLHDTVEDTDVTIEEISEKFGPVVADAVNFLTHKEGEEYDDYIDRVSQNKLAIDVKLSDIKNNMDFSRLKTVTDKDIKRRNKYTRAAAKLIACR